MDYAERRYMYDGIELTSLNGIFSKGIAEIYHQKGFYNLISFIGLCKELNYQISWMNFADQCRKLGFKDETILMILRDLHCITGVDTDIGTFLEEDYHIQRSMLKEVYFSSEKDILEFMGDYINEKRTKNG